MPDNLPNWPSPAINLPLHATIQDARSAGAEEGTIVAAPLAPAKGPIDAKAESMVVVTVKNFFDTPTWKAIRAVLVATGSAVFITFAVTCLNVWTQGKSIFTAGAIDWRATELACEIAAGPILMSGLMALLKVKDNNPVK